MSSRFAWDRRKAITNVAKHGVAFEEAMTVFTDRLAGIFDDLDHSHVEAREIIGGRPDLQRTEGNSVGTETA